MNSQPKKHTSGIILYHFNGVPVVAQPDFWPAPIMLTGVLTWAAGKRKPERSWLQRLGVALVAMPITIFADIGHAMAHTISARYAGAPMDEIRLSSGMPRTLYRDNAVSPQIHIQRSLGGPIFSLIGFTLSLLWRQFSPHGSLSRDLAEASLVGHTFILFGSATPLPMVDGGTILKWKLVEAGESPDQADETLHKISFFLGAALLILGSMLGVFGKRRLVGGITAVSGVAGIATGIGWLK